MQPPQNTLSPDVADAAAQRLIEFSVIGAAFVLVFFFAAALVWWTLRQSAKEIRAARAETQKVNDRSFQATEKAAENNAKVAERLKRVLAMLNQITDGLHMLIMRGGRDAPPNTPEDG